MAAWEDGECYEVVTWRLHSQNRATYNNLYRLVSYTQISEFHSVQYFTHGATKAKVALIPGVGRGKTKRKIKQKFGNTVCLNEKWVSWFRFTHK